LRDRQQSLDRDQKLLQYNLPPSFVDDKNVLSSMG
jgi:hypothetical protein